VKTALIMCLALFLSAVLGSVYLNDDRTVRTVLRQASDLQHAARLGTGHYLTTLGELRLHFWMAYGDPDDVTLTLLRADDRTFCLSGTPVSAADTMKSNSLKTGTLYATPGGIGHHPCTAAPAAILVARP